MRKKSHSGMRRRSTLRAGSLVVILLLFLAGCVEQTYEITRVEDSQGQIVVQDEKIDFEPIAQPEPSPTEKTITFTLIEREPQLIDIADDEITVELLGVDASGAQLNFQGVPLSLRTGESFAGHEYEIRLLSAEKGGFERPRDSWVDFTLSHGMTGLRDNLVVGDDKEVEIGSESVTVKLEFVGLSDGEPVASVSVNGNTANLGEKGEEYFDDGFYLRVRHIYFNDPRETELLDTAILQVTE